jgi:predicted outer membrane repeat protein
VKIYRSLFDSNKARYGGATYHNGEVGNKPLIINSTFTKNFSTELGGGAIYAGTGDGVQPTLVNVTIAYNRVKQGTQEGAVLANDIILKNTIVAYSGLVSDNNGTPIAGPSLNCAGSITDGGHNLEATVSNCVFLVSNGSFPSSTTANLAADIDANGGVTKTLALQTGSQAINNGNPADCPAFRLYDQRGPNWKRSNGVCDIGAFEFQ